MKEKNPLILNSSEPINDGGRKLNFIYVICAIVSFIAFVCSGLNITGCLFGIALGKH